MGTAAADRIMEYYRAFIQSYGSLIIHCDGSRWKLDCVWQASEPRATGLCILVNHLINYLSKSSISRLVQLA